MSELSLNLDDKNAILLGDWLTDKHISAANHVDKSHWICVSAIGCTFGELNVLTVDLPLSLQQHIRLFVHFFTAVKVT